MDELLLEYESLTFVACNDKAELIANLLLLDIDLNIIDYDPKFMDNPLYTVRDFIFDDVEFKECVVNFNCEKTYPLGKVYKGDMILIGDNDCHNGDCNPISSTQQLIEQNDIKTVYKEYVDGKHFIVYGTNIS